MEMLTKDAKDLSQRLEVDANAHKEGTGHTCVVCGAILLLLLFLFVVAFSRAGAM